MPVSADQVIEVRESIGDNQHEFGQRFSRSRYTVIRWETRGVRFKYQSQRWRAWQSAVDHAIEQAEERGSNYEYIENLRQLRILSR